MFSKLLVSFAHLSNVFFDIWMYVCMYTYLSIILCYFHSTNMFVSMCVMFIIVILYTLYFPFCITHSPHNYDTLKTLLIYLIFVPLFLLLIYRYNCQMTKWGVLLHQLQKWWPKHWANLIFWPIFYIPTPKFQHWMLNHK